MNINGLGNNPNLANQLRGAGGADNSVNDIMNDPSLTAEDKVVALLMKVMKNFDKQIEQQGQKINQLQGQQNQGGAAGGQGGAAGGAGGAAGGQGGGNSSIDVETMKLKRLNDKRGQMFDTLRQIVDKYNETAKNMIQSMNR